MNNEWSLSSLRSCIFKYCQSAQAASIRIKNKKIRLKNSSYSAFLVANAKLHNGISSQNFNPTGFFKNASHHDSGLMDHSSHNKEDVDHLHPEAKSRKRKLTSVMIYIIGVWRELQSEFVASYLEALPVYLHYYNCMTLSVKFLTTSNATSMKRDCCQINMQIYLFFFFFLSHVCV